MDAPPPVRRSIGSISLPDWRDGSAYIPLAGADPSAFAWEWLRRTTVYKATWDRYAFDNSHSAGQAARFGLEGLEDPGLAVPFARPVWSRKILPDVLTANVAEIDAPRSERVDLRLLASFVTIVIGRNDTEHLLFSDGRRFLRIDVVEGTLIGCPSALTYLLRGLTRLRGPIDALNRLARLVQSGSFDRESGLTPLRHHRWIQELRVADALASGSDQQRIARVLFGPMIAEKRWRQESSSYRRQVQRLVSAARLRIQAPSRSWFDAPQGSAQSIRSPSRSTPSQHA